MGPQAGCWNNGLPVPGIDSDHLRNEETRPDRAASLFPI